MNGTPALSARQFDRIDAVPESQWDALHDARDPFVRHAFLHALEASGSLRADWGWQPRHLGLWAGDTLVAAAPMYLKQNSHGEFVFDHAWARAYAAHGVDYYPKWLCAVPYSPVTGPRLLAREPALQRRLLDEMTRLAAEDALSSVHVNFHRVEDETAFDDGDWLLREDVQYHWRNPGDWADFDDFLAAMDHRHRKKIRQERRKVHGSGIRFRVVQGREARAADLDAMHGFYLQTFSEYGNSPALTRAFFGQLAERMPEALLMVFAQWHDAPIAGALFLHAGDTLHGRYWGTAAQVPGLHFETCYYQGIEYCLRHGIPRFEPGAQGEHKIARGFLPETVRSRHWIADPRFRTALHGWCAEEREAVRRYAAGLRSRSPFRDTLPPAPF